MSEETSKGGAVTRTCVASLKAPSCKPRRVSTLIHRNLFTSILNIISVEQTAIYFLNKIDNLSVITLKISCDR